MGLSIHSYTVLGIEKETKSEIVLGSFPTEEEAEAFCEMWGWMYDDGKCSYWMRIID